MNKIVAFEDLDCWKKAREQTNLIYTAMKTCRDFWFKDQIQRAAVSVMNNIAEWFGRWNSKERIHFMNMANGSAAEVRSMLYVGLDQELLSQDTFHKIIACNTDLIKLLQGFLRHLHAYKRYEVEPATE